MIRVEALGGLRVYKDGEELRSLPAKPLRAALLVYLAVERESTREDLCTLLWADSTPERARASLSQTLYELRKELGAAWMESVGERLCATEALIADVAEMRRAIDEARRLAALELYNGPFLAGLSLGGGIDFEHWAENKRSEIHASVKQVFRSVVADSSDPAVQTRLARDWVQLDPLDDEAHHALIESLAATGDRAGALEQFRLYTDMIRKELGVEPLEHTLALVDEIRAGTLGAGPRDGADALPTRELDADGPGGESASPPRLEAGLVVSRLIGRGATGAVYLAREPSLKRLVAVKVLDADLAKSPNARARFEREAQSAARISHPNVATVHRVGTTEDNRPYLVMQYVKGGTLADRMKALGPLPPDEVRALLAEAAAALAAAHAAGVIHRDVRPSNLLYEEKSGRTYLADFGVAGVLESGTDEIVRLTRTGELLGNVEYISPEQARGDEVDDRSDIYGLGMLGRALLFGHPLATTGAEACPDQHLLEILDRATSREPRHRPSAAAMEAALRGERLALRSPQLGIIESLRRWWRRR